MIPYTMSNLAGDLSGWLTDRFLPPILSVEGGWEYWMQIDFPAWLDESQKAQYDVRREIVFQKTRLDWEFNSTLAGPQPSAVELKAQSHKYPTNTFVADALADVTKLATLPAAAFAKRISIAVACDDGAHQALLTSGYSEKFTFAGDAGAVLFREL